MALSLFQNIVSFGKGVSEAAAEKTKRQDELLKERVKSLQAAALEQNKTRYKAEFENHMEAKKKIEAVKSAGPLATHQWLVQTGQAKDMEQADDIINNNPSISIPKEFWSSAGQEPMYSTEVPGYDVQAPSAFANMLRSFTGREQLPSGEEQLQAQMAKLQRPAAAAQPTAEVAVPTLPEQVKSSGLGRDIKTTASALYTEIDRQASKGKQLDPVLAIRLGGLEYADLPKSEKQNATYEYRGSEEMQARYRSPQDYWINEVFMRDLQDRVNAISGTAPQPTQTTPATTQAAPVATPEVATPAPVTETGDVTTYPVDIKGGPQVTELYRRDGEPFDVAEMQKEKQQAIQKEFPNPREFIDKESCESAGYVFFDGICRLPPPSKSE